MVRRQLDERQWQARRGELSPATLAPWKTVFNRFDRWASKGIWQRLFEALRRAQDDEAQHRQHDESRSSARSRSKRWPWEHGLGRSRGGLTTKVHLVVDALGLPLAFEITEGQRHDSRAASDLVLRTVELHPDRQGLRF